MSKSRMTTRILEKLPIYLFVLSLCGMAFVYGFFTDRYQIFPFKYLETIKGGAVAILTQLTEYKGRWYYQKTDQTQVIPTYVETEADNGLSLVTSMGKADEISVKIITMNGEVVHSWDIDWFTLWSDATHIAEEDLPKFKPGTHIHGAVLLDNGDLVFNFDTLGLVRLDMCGNVVWKLPYRTHHSIYQDESGYLWVPGQKNHTQEITGFPNYRPPFVEFTLLKVTLEGKIEEELSVMDLLVDNGLQGLLYMASIKNRDTVVSGDTLHVNDLEIFPESLAEGFFQHGDMLLSIRNINAILVFDNSKERKIKRVLVGDFVRQHDPDILDGNTISIYDNNNIAPDDFGHHSRILIHSFADNTTEVFYTGNTEEPFYTNIMGKHQWLDNGNLLITETMKGRAFEINGDGSIVWEYINLIGNNYIGMVEEVLRLDQRYTEKFFSEGSTRCQNQEP